MPSAGEGRLQRPGAGSEGLERNEKSKPRLHHQMELAGSVRQDPEARRCPRECPVCCSLSSLLIFTHPLVIAEAVPVPLGWGRGLFCVHSFWCHCFVAVLSVHLLWAREAFAFRGIE